MTDAFIAIAVFVAYLAVVVVLWRVNHVRYDALVESRDTVVRGIVIPIGLGAVLLAVATTWLGWWEPALFEDPRSGPAWALAVPGLFAVAALLGVSAIDFRSPRAKLLPVLAVGVVLVGFAEELATRGVLIVGGRDGGWSEAAVFFVSTGFFALLHGVNAFFGQSWRVTATQVAVAFLAGTALYVTRMTTGTLLVCMLLHAVWDFGTLGTAATEGETRPVTVLALIATFLLGLVAAWFVVTGA